MTVLVGGVGQLYQGDLDIGRRAAEQLAVEDLGRDVLVEELHYGAVAVAQRLQDIRPSALILVGAEERGRSPGTVERRRVTGASAPDLQAAVSEAVQGYVGIDLVIDVAAALDALPDRVVAVEVEPVSTEPWPELTAQGQRALDEALVLVRAEARRVPLLDLAALIRTQLRAGDIEASAASAAMEALLVELVDVDRTGRWGRTFAERDRLRSAIGAGQTGEGMTHLDWGLWWALIEELDRLQRLEAAV